METIRLKTNSGCPLLGTYSRFEITIPRHHRNDPSELARAPSCIFPSVPRISRARWNRNRNFLSGIMMHRAITHSLHRMHNSYVCHELWTGASTGACTPRAAMGRGVAILSFLSSFPSLLPFFSRSTAIFDPFLRHTRHNRLSWDIFVRSSRAFAEEIAALGHREWQSATRNLHLSSPLIPFNPTYKLSVARNLDSLTLSWRIVASRLAGIYFFLERREIFRFRFFFFLLIVIRERNVDQKLERNHPMFRSSFFTINFKWLHRLLWIMVIRSIFFLIQL